MECMDVFSRVTTCPNILQCRDVLQHAEKGGKEGRTTKPTQILGNKNRKHQCICYKTESVYVPHFVFVLKGGKKEKKKKKKHYEVNIFFVLFCARQVSRAPQKNNSTQVPLPYMPDIAYVLHRTVTDKFVGRGAFI